MNLNRQQSEILAILRQKGTSGMNSYEFRMQFIQLPVRIKELKSKGYLITTRTLKNRSVNYILLHEPAYLAKKTQALTGTTVTLPQPQDEELIRVEHESGLVTWEKPDYFIQKGLGI